MNTPRLDPKSALLGLLLGVLATLAIGAASSPNSGVGRFQIAGTANHGMILDTATGQVWTTYFSNTGGRMDNDFFQRKER